MTRDESIVCFDGGNALSVGSGTACLEADGEAGGIPPFEYSQELEARDSYFSRAMQAELWRVHHTETLGRAVGFDPTKPEDMARLPELLAELEIADARL